VSACTAGSKISPGVPAVDPTEPLASITARLEALATRLDTLDEGMSGRLGSLGGSLENRLAKLESEVGDRPDRATVSALVEGAHAASEQRNAGQLDEAMATFAELILGRGASVQQPPPPPPPDPAPHPAPQGQVVEWRLGGAHRARHRRPRRLIAGLGYTDAGFAYTDARLAYTDARLALGARRSDASLA
jgi:hypothetical protein